MPNAKLFIITQITAMSYSNAVASTEGIWPNPPSPTSAITVRSGKASYAPIAACAPKPNVA